MTSCASLTSDILSKDARCRGVHLSTVNRKEPAAHYESIELSITTKLKREAIGSTSSPIFVSMTHDDDLGYHV